MQRNYKRGFTLIELLVVIAIIGILASIVLASLDSARKKGRDARRLADIKQIQLALELYYDANGSYPVAITGTTLTGPGYISNLPVDPSNLANYRYTPWAASGTPSVCSSYHIGADLEASNSALSGDADKTTETAGTGETNPSGLVLCTATGAPSTDFHGADSGKCDSNDVGTSCYDVTP